VKFEMKAVRGSFTVKVTSSDVVAGLDMTLVMLVWAYLDTTTESTIKLS